MRGDPQDQRYVLAAPRRHASEKSGAGSTGLGAEGAEVISIRHTDGIAALTNIAGSIDVLDLSNPLQPQLLYRLEIDTAAGTPNSVAIHSHHDYFLVVVGTAGVRRDE
jgi:hypothetical protein